MIIGLAQIASIKGGVEKNIVRHLECIDRAAAKRADLVVFPELSLTGYAPRLASELAMAKDDDRLIVFQAISRKYAMTIALGLPLLTSGKPEIGMLVFEPNGSVKAYAKQLLHPDEETYFQPGFQELSFSVKGFRVVPGICYEALQQGHLRKAIDLGADLYMASVAKDHSGTDKAHDYFCAASKVSKLPIVLVNAVGENDDFESCGRSAVWDRDGSMKASLDSQEDLLVYDFPG